MHCPKLPRFSLESGRARAESLSLRLLHRNFQVPCRSEAERQQVCTPSPLDAKLEGPENKILAQTKQKPKLNAKPQEDGKPLPFPFGETLD